MPNIRDYLPAHADVILKLAEIPASQRPENRSKMQALGAVASGLGGMAAGTLTGYGVGRGIEALAGGAKKVPPSALRYGVPILGGGLGLAYNLYKHYELEELKSALETHKNSSLGRVPDEPQV